MTLDKFRRIDLRLDKAYGYIPDNQFAKQGDYNGVELVVQLADNGVVKDQSGTQLLFKWGHNQRKNSGQKYFEALDLSQGVFKVTYPTQMLFEGTVTATIHIIQDGNIIPTRNFTLRVEKDPTNDNLVVAENDFSILQEALLQVNEWNGKFEEKYNGLEEEYNEEINSLNRQLAQTDLKTLGIPLAPLSGVDLENEYNVTPLNFFDNTLWGVQGGNFVKSIDDGENWTIVTNQPGNAHTIIPTLDNEVIVTDFKRVYKSQGFHESGTNVWNEKLVISNLNANGIQPFCIDGDNGKFIVTEYSGGDRAESRYIWVSTDDGNTFNVVFDKLTIDPNNDSHMHGVAYDKWDDRFFVAHGHGDIAGVYYSDNDGLNWNKILGEQPMPAPTVLKATDNGIVCGSDSELSGLYGIERTEKPEDMRMKFIARWDINASRGVQGFAIRAHRDDSTGQVYMSFKSATAQASAALMAGTATTGTQLWQDEELTQTEFSFLTVSKNKIHGVIRKNGLNYLLQATKSTHGVNTADNGNIDTGISNDITSIAIGQGTELNTPREVLIGRNAQTSGTDNGVTIGYLANGGTKSVALGAEVMSSGVGSVTAGYKASSLNSGSVTLGENALTEGQTGVAVGRNTVSGTNSVSLGAGSKSVSAGSVAIGFNTETTAINQVAIGARYIELEKNFTPAFPAAGKGRIFLRDNAGTLELCVGLGAKTTVIATS